MAGRPLSGVPNNFASEGTGSLNNIPLLDQNFTQLVAFNNDSAIGYVNYANDTGVANSYVITLASAPSAYIIGMTIVFNPVNSNTGASVINVNTLGSVAIVGPGGAALFGGEISAGSIVTAVFNGTSFVIVGACALSANVSTTSQVLGLGCAGYTSIVVQSVWTGSPPGMTLLLNNVAEGVPIFIEVINNTGNALIFAIQATNATGAAISNIVALQSGQATGASNVNMSTTGTVISSGLGMCFWGSAVTSGAIILAR
jgi:hypothetical protein